MSRVAFKYLPNSPQGHLKSIYTYTCKETIRHVFKSYLLALIMYLKLVLYHYHVWLIFTYYGLHYYACKFIDFEDDYPYPVILQLIII